LRPQALLPGASARSVVALIAGSPRRCLPREAIVTAMMAAVHARRAWLLRLAVGAVVAWARTRGAGTAVVRARGPA
jgi:hypothetical protein